MCVCLKLTSYMYKCMLDFSQIQVQRLAPGIVQQFQGRCDVCRGMGESCKGMILLMSLRLCCYGGDIYTCIAACLHVHVHVHVCLHDATCTCIYMYMCVLLYL